jgi:hypothetical protein
MEVVRNGGFVQVFARFFDSAFLVASISAFSGVELNLGERSPESRASSRLIWTSGAPLRY